MSKTAQLSIDGKSYELPLISGSEGELAVDVRKMRAETGGVITFDEGYGNTGSCDSKITFIDGEKGILRYRGYSIEELAEHSDFVETSYLVIYGELPNATERAKFSALLTKHSGIHERMVHLFEAFPRDAHPMAILSSMVSAMGCYYPHLAINDHARDLENFEDSAATLISKVRSIAALCYRMSLGLPVIYPKRSLNYCENFLHMMFSDPYDPYIAKPAVAKALNLILLLHADHEQNCSTSTVRMVSSSGANLFASASAGVSALWGPLHGGANMAVLEMLQAIHDAGDDGSKFVENAKNGQARLMGFGHRVYKNYDPRAKLIKKACDDVLETLGIDDPLLAIAAKLEQSALNDEYFIKRKLYPNVDFYSGIIMRAVGIPVNMFTVMFAIGRMPGWIANWREIAANPKSRIYRPRQLYTGDTLRSYVPIDSR